MIKMIIRLSSFTGAHETEISLVQCRIKIAKAFDQSMKRKTSTNEKGHDETKNKRVDAELQQQGSKYNYIIRP